MRLLLLGLLIVFWGFFVLPLWLVGMAFAGEFRFIPDWKGPLDFAVKVAAVYVPPLLIAGILRAKRRESQRKAGRRYAQD